MSWIAFAVALAAISACQRDSEDNESATDAARPDAARPDAAFDSMVPSPDANDADGATCGAECDQCPNDESDESANVVVCSTSGSEGYVGTEDLPYHGPARLEEGGVRLPDGKLLRCGLSGGWGRLDAHEVWVDILANGGRECECEFVGVSIREAPEAPPVLLALSGDFYPEFPLFQDFGLQVDVGALCPRLEQGPECPGRYRQDAQFVFENPDGQTLALFPYHTGRLMLPAGDAEIGVGQGYFSDGCLFPLSDVSLIVRVQGGAN